MLKMKTSTATQGVRSGTRNDSANDEVCAWSSKARAELVDLRKHRSYVAALLKVICECELKTTQPVKRLSYKVHSRTDMWKNVEQFGTYIIYPML